MAREIVTKRFDIYDLSGGQNNQVSPLFIRNNESEIIQNYQMDNVGSLTRRLGTSTRLISAVETAKPVLAMYLFRDREGTNFSNILVGIDKADGSQGLLKTISTGDIWAESKTSETTGSIPNFTTFIDHVFRVTGDKVVESETNPRDTTWGATNCPATITPKYICVWQDRVYVANDTQSSNASRIFWSSLPAENGTITWTTGTDYADINPDDRDIITWIEPFGDKMLVFKEKALYRWTFGQVEPDRIIDIGTPQGLTVKQTHGICFFANRNGVYAYTLGRPKKISQRIRPFIDQIPSLTAMRAEVDDDHYYLYIGTVTVEGMTFTNCMLVYTISLDGWHIETWPYAIHSMARLQEVTPSGTVIALYDAIYIGDAAGFIYQKGTGNSDYNGTTATAINGYVRGKEQPVNFPKSGLLEQGYILSQKAQGAKVNYRIDRAKDFKPWTDLKERITSKPLSGRAKTIQFSFTDNSVVEGSRIEGYSVEYKAEQEIRRK